MIEETITRPGRPKDSAKREEIVLAATELFMENGYELTSMEAVARKASVSKLTIYSHFADKNELFRAIIQYRCDKIGMPSSFAAEGSMEPREAFVKIGRNAAVNIFRADSLRLMRIVQAEALRHPEIVQAYYEAGPRRVKTAFANLLLEYNRRGLLSVADPMRAAEQFFSLLKGERLMRTLMLMAPSPDTGELETHINATVDFFLAAYRPHPDRPQHAPNGECMKKPLSRILAILIVLVIVSGVVFYVFIHRYDETTDDAAISGNTVTISPKVAGYVKTLNIDDNQQVKAGDVLLEIDDEDYITRRDHAQAALDAAKAAAEGAQNNAETTDISAPSNLDAAKAQVDAAQANWDKSVSDLNRMQRLSNEARSTEQLEQAVANEKSMKSSLEDAQAKLRSAQTAPKAIAEAQANSDQLQAQVKQAEADLAQAQIDLANTKVLAPIDGRITKRSVERGNYVQPGTALTSLIGTDLWVVANFKETQLAHMRPGQPVTIKIDAYPDVKITGKVDSVQAGTGAFFSAFPPENATGNFVKIVQRVPVKITFDNISDANMTLGPGMSVDPIVDTSPQD